MRSVSQLNVKGNFKSNVSFAAISICAKPSVTFTLSMTYVASSKSHPKVTIAGRSIPQKKIPYASWREPFSSVNHDFNDQKADTHEITANIHRRLMKRRAMQYMSLIVLTQSANRTFSTRLLILVSPVAWLGDER